MMNENDLKGMLKDIIDNSAEYACRIHPNGRWNLYKLGEPILDDLEFCKVKAWYVFSNDNKHFGIDFLIDLSQPEYLKFQGTYDECLNYVKSHKAKYSENTLSEILKDILYEANLDSTQHFKVREIFSRYTNS